MPSTRINEKYLQKNDERNKIRSFWGKGPGHSQNASAKATYIVQVKHVGTPAAKSSRDNAGRQNLGRLQLRDREEERRSPGRGGGVYSIFMHGRSRIRTS